MRTSTLAAFVVLAVFDLPAASFAQQPEPPTPLFNGTSLDGWDVPEGKAKQFVAVEGVLQVTGHSGWLLSQQTYDDFVLTFEARPVGPDSAGGVLVRILVGPKHRLAYEVQVSNGRQPSPVLLRHDDETVASPITEPPALVSIDGEWHRYRVECVEDRISVSRDGTSVVEVWGLPLNTGRIGLHAGRGVLELRHLKMWKVNVPRPPRLRTGAEGVFLWGSSGVTNPRPVTTVKPQFTWLAMTLGVQGEVRLECVVEPDGHVEQCVVVRRLFRELDAEALRAAKQWRFIPATRNGEPVAVVVGIAMTFTLRK
jgi:TonB family protein